MYMLYQLQTASKRKVSLIAHFFLIPKETKKAAVSRAMLFSPGQVALNCADRTEQHLFSISIHVVLERRDRKFVEVYVLATNLGTMENI